MVLTDIQVDKGRGVAEGLGEGAVFVEADVTSGDDWDRVVTTALRAFGRLDGPMAILSQAGGALPEGAETT